MAEQGANSSRSKWDLKQLGIGGGSVLGILFLFQEKGLDFVSQTQQFRDQVIIERTKANSDRIEKLEKSVGDLDSKLERGFDGLRQEIRTEVSKLSDILILDSKERYTKQEHIFYAKTVDEKIEIIKDEIRSIKTRLEK